ncbi:ATP-binding protein [Azospirillum sp. TSO22-1]|uniref:ATP-binding protein n=1 Tax=Azospirillum sp. TSO22-1 TaxID=716789 RepID=UPI000D65D903|nr:ATP-binding protein [Azospirillum sp. TSO22-1]
MQSTARFGVRAKLFLAFVSVAALSVIATLVGWWSYARLSEGLAEIGNRHLPALGLSTRLAEHGGAIIATAPILAAARTEEDVALIRTDLEQHLDAIRDLERQLDVKYFQEGDEPGRLIANLVENLRRLDSEVRTRLRLGRENRDAGEHLRWFHADFLDEIKPLVADARFNIQIALEGANGSEGAVQIETFLNRVREEGSKSDALQELNANGNLAVGLIARAATAPTLDLLDETINFLDETADLIEVNLKTLGNRLDTVTLRQVTYRIFDLSRAADGVPAVRRAELTSRANSQHLLTQNRLLVANLNRLIAGYIRHAEIAASAAAAQSNSAIGRGRQALLAVPIASLTIAILVAWLYVNRNLMSRLLVLRNAATQIAAGNLQTPIPLMGEDEIADMAAALVVFRDTAIQVEEANAQAIIDNAQAGLVTTDEYGKIEFVSPVAAKLIDGETTHLTDRLELETCGAIHAFFSKVRERSDAVAEPFSVMSGGRRPDGAPVPLQIAIRPFFRRNQLRFIVTITDMTERLQVQQLLEHTVAQRTADLTRALAELREAQDELVQAGKLAALGQLAAGVGHELNQPLAAIRSYAHNARILLERSRGEEAERNVGKIIELAGRMASITNHLKRFARRPGTQLGPVLLAPVVEAAVALFGTRFKDEGAEITIDIADPSSAVSAEEVRLEQILVNLLSNALDAVRGSPRRCISIVVTADGMDVRIRVSDTGSGIPEDKVLAVFDPFYTTKETGAGLGLGLSISYNIAKDFGGTLTAESSADGATFTLALRRCMP